MTAIQWTNQTWNPVTGCTRVSTGCDNCYAVGVTARLAGIPATADKYGGLVHNGHFNGRVRCHEQALALPLSWRKPRRVFVNSMSDLFHEDVPQGFIHEVFNVIRNCPQHTFQILTKRPHRAASIAWTCAKYEADFGRLPNVWLGTSCEDQATADARIPHLLRCPAAVRFLSCEPLLSDIDLHDAFYRPRLGPGDTYDPTPVSWVIVGGESGSDARPCNLAWVRSIVRQCRAAGVAVFVKQLGSCATDAVNGLAGHRLNVPAEAAPLIAKRLRDPKGGDPDEWPADLRVREYPETPTQEVTRCN